MLKPKASLSRNGFDRSYLQNFTAKIGELLPIMTLETVPGSHYEINVSDMMRTIPMQQAAFIRASQHFEFYFVPYRQLWHRWDDFYTKRSMPLSAGVSFNVPQVSPNASFSDIINQFQLTSRLSEGLLPNSHAGDLGEAIGLGCAKVYNLLGYGHSKSYCGYISRTDDPVAVVPDYLSEKNVNLFRPAAYQKIFYDYYRQPFYDLPFDGCQYAFNLDDSNLSTGAVSSNVTTDDARAYYRLARLFQMHYRQWKKDLFTGVLPNTQFGAVSVVSTGSSSEQTINLDVVANLANNLVSVDLPPVSKAMSESTSSSAANIHYKPINVFDDFSNGILREGNYDKELYLGNQLKDDGVRIGLGTDGEAKVANTGVTGTASGSIAGGTGSFSVLSLVYAQAIQRWREITLRSGFRATEQYEGHFGVKPIFSEKDKCVFIDSVSSPLQVNTVTNTNGNTSTGAVPLGDLGANGTSVLSSDKTIKFDAKDFGIIMCIYSVLPEATYQADGVDMMNTKVLPDDFFVPEFENIGMAHVPMSIFKLGSNNGTNGYAARYYEYKVNIDKQSDEFSDPRTVDYVGGTHYTFASAFYGWSPCREISLDVSQSGIVSPTLFARDLYVSPMYFKDIFSRLPFRSLMYTHEFEDKTNPYSAQLTIGDSVHDSFVNSCYFNIKCVQPMSVLGMPRY